MKRNPIIAVFSGGISGERDVSIRSGEAVAAALHTDGSFPVEVYNISERSLPRTIDPAIHVVFSTLHGVFGEDGGMQELLEKGGFYFSGSDARSSRLCMDKSSSKAVAGEAGISVPPEIRFRSGKDLSIEETTKKLSSRVVLKPNAEGSSLGLKFFDKPELLEGCLAGLEEGEWLLEKRILGREVTVGVIEGRSLGVVEVEPSSGVYDYSSKYTPGFTRYYAPAAISPEATCQLRRAAEIVFKACGCRDFARIDFMLLEENDEPYFIEINTLPGLTETSLLPMSAACEGIHFKQLAEALVMPAVLRFLRAQDSC